MAEDKRIDALSKIGKVSSYQTSSDGKTEFNGPLSWEAFERTDAYKAMPKNWQDELKAQLNNMDIPGRGFGGFEENPRRLLIQSEADSTGTTYTPKRVHIGILYDKSMHTGDPGDKSKMFGMLRSMNLENGKTSDFSERVEVAGDGSISKASADNIQESERLHVKYDKLSHAPSDVGEAALSALAKSAGVSGVQVAHAPDAHDGDALSAPVTPGGASGKPRTV